MSEKIYNVTLQRRSKERKRNKTRKAYFREYYSGERYAKHLETVQWNNVMRYEAGYYEGLSKADAIKKRKTLLGRKIIVYVDGQKLVNWLYVKRKLIKNLSAITIENYLRRGYIPYPPYRLKYGNTYRKYYSMYQVKLINLCWSKSKNKKPLKDRVERLHEKWKQDPLLGGQSNDRDPD